MLKEYSNFIIDNISKEFDFKLPNYTFGKWIFIDDILTGTDYNIHYSKERLYDGKYSLSKIKVKLKIIEIYNRCLKVNIEFEEFVEEFFININLNKSPNVIFSFINKTTNDLIINKLLSVYGYEYFINKELKNINSNKEKLNEYLNYIKIKKNFDIEHLYDIVNSISINDTKICNAYCKLGLMNFNNNKDFPIYSWDKEKLKQLSFDELFDLHYQYNI
jgi:hypothetical protein